MPMVTEDDVPVMLMLRRIGKKGGGLASEDVYVCRSCICSVIM